MKNVIWWITTILFGLNAINNFYDAGKGEFTRTEEPLINLLAGFVGVILFLWGLLTLV